MVRGPGRGVLTDCNTMSKEQQLSSLLTDAGYSEAEPDPDLDAECTRAGYLTRAELISACRGKRAAWRALVRRDLLTWFDAGRDYQEPRAHASLAMVVVRALRPFRSFDEAWSDKSGLLMTSDEIRVLQPPSGEPRNSVMLDAVLLMAGEVAKSEGSDLRPCTLQTGDDTAAIALLPKAVALRAFEHELLTPQPPWEFSAVLLT